MDEQQWSRIEEAFAAAVALPAERRQDYCRRASGDDPKFMRAECERSLSDMRTDVIDLYYFHHCMFGEQDEYCDDEVAGPRHQRPILTARA